MLSFIRLPFGDDGRQQTEFVLLGLSRPLRAILGQSHGLGLTILQIVLAFSVLALLLAGFISRAVTGPIHVMVRAIEDFSASRAMHARLPIERGDELGLLARSIQDMQWQITHQLTELDRQHSELEHLARHDPLTGLPNRLMFYDRLEYALAAARRTGQGFALLYVDLDLFKEINDRLGHAMGDRLLQATADILRAGVRETDTVARLGGDEFILICQTIGSRENIQCIARKLLDALNQPVPLDGHTLRIRASIGISVYPDHGRTGEALVQSADQAMYRAKALRQQTFCFASD